MLHRSFLMSVVATIPTALEIVHCGRVEAENCVSFVHQPLIIAWVIRGRISPWTTGAVPDRLPNEQLREVQRNADGKMQLI